MLNHKITPYIYYCWTTKCRPIFANVEPKNDVLYLLLLNHKMTSYICYCWITQTMIMLEDWNHQAHGHVVCPDYGILVCDVTQFGELTPPFRRKLLLSFLRLQWILKEAVVSSETSDTIHKTTRRCNLVIWSSPAVKTSNLTVIVLPLSVREFHHSMHIISSYDWISVAFICVDMCKHV
jgi:hypothetical protein